MVNVSIRELAERCGVAVSTVSRAMNNRSDISPATRERILTTARELGYVPNANARGLKIADLQTIVVVIQGHTSELLVEILGHLQHDLFERGLDVFLQHIADDNVSLETLTQLMKERCPDCVVFLGHFGATNESSGADINRAIEEFTTPVVFCTTAPAAGAQSRHSSITVDDENGTAELTRLLISGGHTKIAFGVASPGPAVEGPDVWACRYRGYRRALSEAGIEIDPALIIPATDVVDIYSASTGHDSVAAWLGGDHPPFTALVTSCDAVGLGTLRALGQAGLRVPDDVAVTAFDGIELSEYTTPTLTTLVQPLREIARRTGDVIASTVANPNRAPQQILLNGTIRLGESTS